MGIVLGLAAALAFGLADFCARFAARKVGNFKTLFYMQLVGLTVLTLWLALVERPQNLDGLLVGLALLLGVGNTIAGLSLYRAFEVGVLAIVSPIAASYGAVSLILGLITGQKPSALQLVGLVVTIAGVMLAAAPLGGFKGFAGGGKFRQMLASGGIVMALLAAACFGVVFWGLGYVAAGLGGVLPVWEIRLAGIVVVAVIFRPLGQSIKPPQGKVWWLIIAVGLLDTSAFLCLNYGVRLADSSIVSVLSSLFSAFTILLARLFLNETLSKSQWVGVGLILVGVGSISAG